MIGDRVVYFFFYNQYLKLYNGAIWFCAARYVLLNYEQIAKSIV